MTEKLVQGTPEWFSARCGKSTASNFSSILATIKTGEAADRRNYRTQLVLERLTGTVVETFSNDAMKWGVEKEPEARAAFELKTGLTVKEVGFLTMGDWIGASPDGLIDDDEGLEIKCPISSTHLATLVNGRMDPKHIPQVQGCMWISDRKRWHFVSYDPRFPVHLRLFHQVIERDPVYIQNLAVEVQRFNQEVADSVAALAALRL